jgi:transcriptional regulator with XRE-family HTH domain
MLESDYGLDTGTAPGDARCDPDDTDDGMRRPVEAGAHEECSPPVGHERPQTPLGVYLERWRRKRRFSQALLADTAQISSQYLRQLEQGYRPKGAQPVDPSPRVLRRLADALADEHPDEADVIYVDLMELAGYGRLPPPAPSLTLPPDLAQQRMLLRALLEAELGRLDDPLRAAVVRLVLESLPPTEG